MKDIMANGYRAGGNTKFFVKDGDLTKGKENLMKRLNMDDTSGDDEMSSLLAFPMSAGQYDSGNMDIAMSVTSRYLPYEVASAQHKSFPGGEEMYKFYERMLSLRAVHFGEDLRASENMEYMSQVSASSPPKACLRIVRIYACALTFFLAVSRLRAGLDQQRALLRRPPPPLRSAHQGVHPAHPGHGPLGPRRAPWRCEFPPHPRTRFAHVVCFFFLPIRSPFSDLPVCSQARWRRGEAVNMISAREAMMTYEQLR